METDDLVMHMHGGRRMRRWMLALAAPPPPATRADILSLIFGYSGLGTVSAARQ